MFSTFRNAINNGERIRPSKSNHPQIKELYRDDSGVLGMPFRLLVAVVTVSLIAPAVYSGWSTVDYMQIDSRTRAEISRVLTAAQMYFQAGSGGEIMDISLRGGSFTRIEYVVFGDYPGEPYSKTVRYKLSGGLESTITIRNPSVPLSSLQGGPLTLFEGSHKLRIECIDGATVTMWLE